MALGLGLIDRGTDGAIAAEDLETGHCRGVDEIGHRDFPAADGGVVQLENRAPAAMQHAGIMQQK